MRLKRLLIGSLLGMALAAPLFSTPVKADPWDWHHHHHHYYRDYYYRDRDWDRGYYDYYDTYGPDHYRRVWRHHHWMYY